MGYEATRVRHTFGRDGGLDILFWPARPCPIPFLGAVQVKHHRAHSRKTGPGPVREMAGIRSSHPLQIGMVVTNTSFTADARWFADHQPAIIRLRDMIDLKRWIASNFTDEAEWREMPVMIELAPGVTIDLSKQRGSSHVKPNNAWHGLRPRGSVPPYEIISYPIRPPVGGNHFGAKPIVASTYHTQPDEPWNKEFWGRTEQEAIAKASIAIAKWINGPT